ncbi:MAG: Ig-like domain-containing protein [Thaumarchaeota archaeon]|nr:Ig-like domain-containing protein [Nitrososphaerota archaeon]
MPAQPPGPLRTNLNLDAKDHCDGVCSISLIGTLTDNEGNPIEGMPVMFTVNTTFGTLRIASLYTNKQGIALANYSAGSIGMYEFAALFPGGGGYGASKFLVTRHILYAGGEPTESLFAPRNVAVGIAIGAVLSVWGAYAFVLGQLGGIFRERKKHQGGDNRQAP